MAPDRAADEPCTFTAVRLHEYLHQAGQRLTANLDSLDEALVAHSADK